MTTPRPLVPLLVAIAVIGVLGGVVAMVYAGRQAPPQPLEAPAENPAETARDLSVRMQQSIIGKGDLTIMLPDAKTLAEKNPGCFEAQLLLGQLYIALNRYDMAYAPARQALSLRPLGQELTKLLGTLAANTERLDEAEKLYRQVVKKSPRTRERGMVWAMLGGVLCQKNRWDEADVAYAAALEDDRFLIPAHAARAEIALKKNDLSAALGRIEEGMAWASTDPSVDQTPLLVMKARIILTLGRAEDAERLLVTELTPAQRLTVGVTACLAEVWAKENLPGKAAAHYEAVLAELEKPPEPGARPTEKTDETAKQAQIKEARAGAARWWHAAGDDAAAKKYE